MHLISGPRLPFTAVYFGAIAMTIYFVVGVSLVPAILLSKILTMTAALYCAHTLLVRHSACRIGVVSHQLLPDGKHRLALCGQSWRRPSSSLDERLIYAPNPRPCTKMQETLQSFLAPISCPFQSIRVPPKNDCE
jgi:hypothetical protein